MNRPKNVKDRADLQQHLRALGVPPDTYSLDGGLPNHDLGIHDAANTDISSETRH